MELEVIKKDGTHEGWDWNKIEVAIHKAAQRANAKKPAVVIDTWNTK